MMRHPLHAVTVVITMTARHSVSQEHRVSRGAALKSALWSMCGPASLGFRKSCEGADSCPSRGALLVAYAEYGSAGALIGSR